MSRPTSYTLELAAEIVQRLAAGEVLAAICKDAHIPHPSTIYRWCETREHLREAMTRAREAGADLLAAQVVEVADTERDPQRARVRCDARKWYAGVINPKKYGPKLDVTVSERPSLSTALKEARQRIARPVHDQQPALQSQDIDLFSIPYPQADDTHSQDLTKLLDLDDLSGPGGVPGGTPKIAFDDSDQGSLLADTDTNSDENQKGSNGE